MENETNNPKTQEELNLEIKTVRKSLGDVNDENLLFTDEEIEAEWKKTNNENLCLYHFYSLKKLVVLSQTKIILKALRQAMKN